MPKTAILVEQSIWTRVVVDIPEDADPNDDKYFDIIDEAVRNNIRGYIKNDPTYPYGENITKIERDTEIPYGDAPEDHTYKGGEE